MKSATYKTTFDVYLPATKDSEPRFLETIEVNAYKNFGEEFLTPESSELIEQTKARHLGLLTGKDIKSLRKRLNLSQKQLTELLDCGEKSISRWENGQGYPTGIVNRLLRLLDEGFLAPASLKAVQGPRPEISEVKFLENWEAMKHNSIYATEHPSATTEATEEIVPATSSALIGRDPPDLPAQVVTPAGDLGVFSGFKFHPAFPKAFENTQVPNRATKVPKFPLTELSLVS